MAAVFKFLFVFLAIFAVAFAWPVVETDEGETKAVQAASEPGAVPADLTETHDHHANEATKVEEQIRPKRSCKKLGFKSKSGRTVEGSHGC